MVLGKIHACGVMARVDGQNLLEVKHNRNLDPTVRVRALSPAIMAVFGGKTWLD